MKTKHRILSVLTILALVASLTAVMVAPAAAALPLAISPASGPPGTVVTLTGVVTGITAPAPGILTAVGPAPAHLPVITPVHFMTGAGGQIALIVTILPGAPLGEATFTATVGIATATGPFTVTLPPVLPAAITLAPTSGLRGTAVTVTGVRFPADAPGILTAVGPAPAHLPVITPVTFLTTAAGAFSASVTILPAAPFGAATFTATVGGVPAATAPFTVIAVPVPTISLSPIEGRWGISVTVTGTGFPVSAPGIITAPGVIIPVTFATDAAGVIIAPVTITILPVAPLGPATITATVGVAAATAPFMVLPPLPPTIVPLSPTAGARGTVVAVTGAHFPAGAPGVITATPAGVIAPVTFTTTAAGTIPPAITATILADAPFGPATFTATVGIVTAIAPFTVQAPFVTVTPIGGLRGATVTVTGVGFPLATGGTIIATPAGVIAPVPFTTTAAGTFSTPVTILPPPAPLGPATITATVGAVTANATYTVGITPAITLTPIIGLRLTPVTVTGFGFPLTTAGTITAPGVILPVPFITTAAGTIPPATTATILAVAPFGTATITATVGAITATATFSVAPPLEPARVTVEVGLAAIWPHLGESVWLFKHGTWYQYFIREPGIVPEGLRLTHLERGEAYWIFLTRPVTAHFGGMFRTLAAGWHNISWL
ncbi:MAG: hypothetical protein DDT30_01461 [Dehalococcoidia bacterium]|nr:hypothetical protein [Bacillota bacterium]